MMNDQEKRERLAQIEAGIARLQRTHALIHELLQRLVDDAKELRQQLSEMGLI